MNELEELRNASDKELDWIFQNDLATAEKTALKTVAKYQNALEARIAELEGERVAGTPLEPTIDDAMAACLTLVRFCKQNCDDGTFQIVTRDKDENPKSLVIVSMDDPVMRVLIDAKDAYDEQAPEVV